MKWFPATRSFIVRWLSKFHAGQPEHTSAWWEFDALYGGPILSICRSLGLAENDAIDVRQEVYMAVRDRIHTYRGDSPFRYWIGEITRNKVFDVFRKMYRSAEALEVLQRLQAVKPEDEPFVDEVDSKLDLPHKLALAEKHLKRLSASAQFDEETIRAFYLTTIGGLTARDAAVVLGKSTNAIEAALSRCKRFLKGI